MSNRTTTTNSNPATRPQDDLRDAAAATREGIRDMGSAAKDLAADRVDALAQEVEELKGKLETKIEAKPLHSAVIAAGAGLFLGLLLRRN